MKPASPLPWRRSGVAAIVDKSGGVVVSMMYAHDVEYIVRAANAFPKLVEALDAMVEHHYEECDLPTSACAFCHAAREALALAKGEKFGREVKEKRNEH